MQQLSEPVATLPPRVRPEALDDLDVASAEMMARLEAAAMQVAIAGGLSGSARRGRLQLARHHVRAACAAHSRFIARKRAALADVEARIAAGRTGAQELGELRMTALRQEKRARRTALDVLAAAQLLEDAAATRPRAAPTDRRLLHGRIARAHGSFDSACRLWNEWSARDRFAEQAEAAYAFAGLPRERWSRSGRHGAAHWQRLDGDYGPGDRFRPLLPALVGFRDEVSAAAGPTSPRERTYLAVIDLGVQHVEDDVTAAIGMLPLFFHSLALELVYQCQEEDADEPEAALRARENRIEIARHTDAIHAELTERWPVAIPSYPQWDQRAAEALPLLTLRRAPGGWCGEEEEE